MRGGGGRGRGEERERGGGRKKVGWKKRGRREEEEGGVQGREGQGRREGARRKEKRGSEDGGTKGAQRTFWALPSPRVRTGGACASSSRPSRRSSFAVGSRTLHRRLRRAGATGGPAPEGEARAPVADTFTFRPPEGQSVKPGRRPSRRADRHLSRAGRLPERAGSGQARLGRCGQAQATARPQVARGRAPRERGQPRDECRQVPAQGVGDF